MNRIYNFLDFIGHLDEIQFSGHYLDRTSNTSEPNNQDSRILSIDLKGRKYGYKLDGFKDSSGKIISNEEFKTIFSFLKEEEIQDLVYAALREMTRSSLLSSWESKSEKEFLALYLGRMFFYGGEGQKYYPQIKCPVEKKEGDLSPTEYYPSGEDVWAVVGGFNMGVTIKYWSKNDPDAIRSLKGSFWNDLVKTGKIMRDQWGYFDRNFVVDYPYGKGFEVMIDLTDVEKDDSGRVTGVNLSDIRTKIKSQIKGEKITLGPRPKSKLELPKGEQQLNLSPGTKIMLQAKESMQEYEVLPDPIKPKRGDILNREKFKSDKQMEVKFTTIRDDKKIVTKRNIYPNMVLMVKDKEGTYREARITDRLYIQDARLDEPVNLAYRFS